MNFTNSTTVPPYPVSEPATIVPVLERRVAGATGGIVQILWDQQGLSTIGFLHRTVYDWLQSIRPIIEGDGPAESEPGLAITAALVSVANHKGDTCEDRDLSLIFTVGRSCGSSPETRSRLLAIVEQIQDGVAPKTIFDHDSANRSVLAVRGLCVPYLQAKLESVSRSTGLELPRRLHLVPVALWPASRKWLLTFVLNVLVGHVPSEDVSGNELRVLHLRLKTLEVLLQGNFAPRRVLRAKFKAQRNARAHDFPPQFWDALYAVLDGKGFAELTGVDPNWTPPDYVPED